MTAVNESFTVQQWSNAVRPRARCPGPHAGRRVSVRSDGGGVRHQRRRGARSAPTQCLDRMPTLARNVHSQDGHSWRTRCSTPPATRARASSTRPTFVAAARCHDRRDRPLRVHHQRRPLHRRREARRARSSADRRRRRRRPPRRRRGRPPPPPRRGVPPSLDTQSRAHRRPEARLQLPGRARPPRGPPLAQAPQRG